MFEIAVTFISTTYSSATMLEIKWILGCQLVVCIKLQIYARHGTVLVRGYPYKA